MSDVLSRAVLDHYFGWMGNSETWKREREIVYAMWAEIERLRLEARQASATWAEDKRADLVEIVRLRGDLEAMNDSLKAAAQALNDEEREIERLRGELALARETAEGFREEARRAADLLIAERQNVIADTCVYLDDR